MKKDTVTVTCKFCNKYSIEVSKEKYNMIPFYHVQDLFPDMPVDDREILISGMCGRCWNKFIGEED